MNAAQFNAALAELEREFPLLATAARNCKRERRRVYNAARRASKNALNRAYYWRHRERVLVRVNAYNALHADDLRRWARARTALANASITDAQWTAIKNKTTHTEKTK